MTTQGDDRIRDRLDALRAQFVDRCRGELTAIERFATRDNLAPDDRTALAAMAHRLAGAGGTFGHGALSIAAAELETRLETTPESGRADLAGALERLLVELRKVAALSR